MDDSFTEKLLQRTKARQENLNRKITSSGLQTPQKKASFSNSSRKRPSPLREENVTVEAVQAKKQQTVESNTKSTVKKKVSFKSNEVGNGECKENNLGTPSLKGRLNKLVQLHSGDDVLDSPPTSSKRLYPDLSSVAAAEENLPVPVNLKRRDRLANLANNYRNLEEEIPQPKPVVAGSKSIATISRVSSDRIKEDKKSDSVKSSTFTQALEKFKTSNINKVGASNNKLKRKSGETSIPINPQNTTPSISSAKINSTKAAKTVWDEGIVKSLKAQGFVQSPSKSKLEYEFDKNKLSNTMTPRKDENFRTPAPPPLPSSNGQNKINFKKDEKNNILTPEKKQITPKKTPIPQEKVAFSPVRDIARFDIKLKSTSNVVDNIVKPSSPAKNKTDPSILPLSARVALFEQATQVEAQAAAAARALSSPKKVPVKKTISSPSPQSKLANVPSSVGKATETIHRKLQQNTEEWKSKEIISKIKSDRRNDMHLLLNRWEQATAIMENDSVQTTTKNIYSSKQSLVSSESELEVMESSDSDGSVGSDFDDSTSEPSEEVFHEPHISSSVAKNVQLEQEYSDDEEVSISEALDEALDTDSSENENDGNSSFMQLANEIVNTPVKSPPKPPRVYRHVAPKSPSPQPVRNYFPLDPVSENGPLLHSVSFYRRQKQEVRTPPTRTIVRREEVRSPPLATKNEIVISLKEKIQVLQDEVKAQESIIGQTSQALNLCRASVAFYGSAEQVEGERLLLIATHKRQACNNEIQRLKTESALSKGMETAVASGSLSIKNISLILKKDFLNHSDNGRSGEFVHFFLCLVKHGAQVISTQMVSTMDGISNGMLKFPNLINLRDLNYHFNILLECYGLQSYRNQVSNDRMKTLSKKDKSKLSLTPLRKQSKSDSKTISIQSPAGPSAVRTSSFELIGYANINLKSLNRKTWTLEKIPSVSPLDGNLLMNIHCSSDYNIEERGFLTMFDDVSGFGAWHRRWCCLSGTSLSFWKYPDDEKNRKEPIGSINLRACVTSTVTLLSRDLCARHHTFMLMTIRTPNENDKESLVCQRFGPYATTKHLLSADTKEERILWCNVLNKALHNIRMWDPEAVTPFDLNPSETEC